MHRIDQLEARAGNGVGKLLARRGRPHLIESAGDYESWAPNLLCEMRHIGRGNRAVHRSKAHRVMGQITAAIARIGCRFADIRGPRSVERHRNSGTHALPLGKRSTLLERRRPPWIGPGEWI